MRQSHSINHSAATDIAIVGMACRFPGARGVEEFWRNLRDGVESLVLLSDEELLAAGVSAQLLSNPNYVKAGMILDGIEMFDASFFGFSPREAELMDPQHRLFLECSWEVLEAAGYNCEKYKRAVGVFAGVGANAYLFNFTEESEAVRTLGSYQAIISNDKDFLATRVSYKLNLKGPSLSIQTACSTSLVATHLACQSLLNGECDMALAGGVSIRLPQRAGYLYEPESIHSPDGHCRAFDARAQGPGGGNGVGIVLLKRLSDALADGDNVYAVVKGSAVNNDGALKVGYTAPSVDGQTKVIMEALAVAGVDPATVGFVEAHGTGTALGDPIEILALTKAFRAHAQEKEFCAIGSVKTNIGHLDTAAGVAGLIKTALALKNKQIPPSLHFEQPNPNIDFANSPFYVNTALVEWEAGLSPRRAGVSSFGIGGTNAHFILEEAPPIESLNATRPYQLLLLSCKTKTALETATANLVEHFGRQPELNLADAAYTLQVGRKSFNHRRMLVCRDLEDARSALATQDPQRVFTSVQEAAARPVIFMFPGVGAQYVQMGRELYYNEEPFRKQVDRCLELLKPKMRVDLRSVLYPIDEQDSRQTEKPSIALASLFVIEYALAQLLMNWGVRPYAMIGHSFGEYVAACLAGVISLDDALSLVAVRGRLIEQLPKGSMISVPLSERDLRPFLGKRLSLAAINGPALCVVSGPTEAIEELEKTLSDNRIEVGRLHTAFAFHSEMVKPILDEFTGFVRTLSLRAPEIPYVSTLTGTWITAEEATNPDYWAQHLRQTVRFGEGLCTLWDGEDRILLEVGPGQTLSTLARQHTSKPSRQVILSSLRHPHEPHSDVAFLLNAIGRLWLAGAQVDWQHLYASEQRRRVALPTYPFESQRYWIEAPAQTRNGHSPPPASAASNKREPVNWFYLHSWKRSLRSLSIPKRESTPHLVFSDGYGFGDQVARQLRAAGHPVVTVEVGQQFASLGADVYTIDPTQPEDYRALLRDLRRVDKLPRKIVHLWSIGPIAQAVAETGMAEELDRGFYTLVHLTQMLANDNITIPLEIVVIANGLHDITGEESLCPQKATIIGPCIVIPQECPNITCRTLDVVLPVPGSEEERNLVERVVAELLTDPTDLTIAFRNQHRWAQTFEPVQLKPEGGASTRLREAGVYLIVGGLGGVGHILATCLAQTKRVKLVLTGRTVLPNREDWEDWLAAHDKSDDAGSAEIRRKIRKVRALEELGAEVMVQAADVANLEQMRQVVDVTYTRFGSLHGVIHAAGVSKDKAFCTIQETVRKDSEWFRLKVQGLLVLDEVLGDKELDFCLLTSSLSSILGGLGHVSYSASNLFMDAFAHKQNRNHRTAWTSINWEGWRLDEEFSSAPNLASALLEFTLTDAEGMDVLQRILSADRVAQLVVSTGDLQSRIDKWIKREWLRETEAVHVTTSATLHPRPDLPNPYVAPTSKIQEEIVPIWQQLIGIEEIGIYDNFFELGGSSLLATQLVSRLRDKFQVEVALRSFFESPTIVGLAESITSARAQSVQSPLPAIPRIPRQAHAALLSSEGLLTVPEQNS